MSEKFSQNARDDAHTANLEAIRTASSFDALRESLASSYDHDEALRDATASLDDEIRGLERLEREEIDAELEQCLAALPQVEDYGDNGNIAYEDLGRTTVRRISRLLAKEAITAEQVEISLALLERIARSDEEALAWGALRQLPRERIPEEPALRILEMGAKSDTVLVNTLHPGYPSFEYSSFLTTMQHVIGEKQGNIYKWLQGGKSVIDERLKSVVENDHFLPHCIDLAAQTAEKRPDIQERHYGHRSFEKYLLTSMLGLPEEMATEFQVAFSSRTRLLDKQTDNLIPLKNGGGINTEKWTQQLKRYAANIREIGAPDAGRLRQELGIVNFDRPSAEQLKRTLRALDGDETLRQQAESHEATIVLLDALGDYNGAINSDLYHVEAAASRTDDGEPTGDIVLFAEINQASDVYRHVIKFYQRCGIQASNLVISTHGSSEGLYFRGNQYDSAEAEPKKEFSISREDMLNSAADRFFKTYMQPGKTSGHRNVLLRSCSLMKYRNLEHPGQSPSEDEAIYQEMHEPAGEALARAARPDTYTTVYGVGENFGLIDESSAPGKKEILVPFKAEGNSAPQPLPVRSARTARTGMQRGIHLQGFPLNKTAKEKKAA